MQQRVGLARALAMDPTLLLMDEPFGSLDYQTAERLRDEVLKIHSQTRKAMLIVSHNIDEVLYLSNRVLVLSARPARILKEFTLHFPTPRWESNIQGLSEFAELRAEVKHLVMGV
jgi:NitT/TauT family transport system ATP-binding protein